MVSAGQQYCSPLDRQGPGTRGYLRFTDWFSRGTSQNRGMRTRVSDYRIMFFFNLTDLYIFTKLK